MSDNSEFWKELLGDDYEELIDIKSKPDQPRKAEVNPTGPKLPDEKTDSPQPPRQNAAKPQSIDPGNRPDGARGQSAGARPEEQDEGARFYQLDLPNPRGIPRPRGMAKANKPPEPTPHTGDKDRPGRQTGPDDDFQMEFDFDGEYGDVPERRNMKPARGKKTGCLGGILYAAFIIAICLLLASLLWLAATDVLGLGNENERVQVTVPEDYTVSSITDMLHEKGLIRYKFLFKLYAGFSKADEKITPGTFELNMNYDYRALVNGMNIHNGNRVETDVTIPEGYTLRQIFALLDANYVCEEADLWEAAANYDFNYEFLDKATLGDKYRLEGYLFPDTYSFYMGSTATGAIEKMLKNFDNKFKEEYAARAEELGYSVHDIVIIASMIEKEAGADAERDTIASVIYNRLKSSSFPYLQIDATIYYAIAETGEPFSTDVDSPYNTYNTKGLPAGPIANPGIASIKAALYPESTTYYFYALNKSGTHTFFSNLSAFNQFITSDEYGG
jgi:UPF0755 protein